MTSSVVEPVEEHAPAADERVPLGAWEWARREPGRIALEDERGRTTTFGELGARVNQLSRALRKIGVTEGGVAAALVHNEREYFELILATGQIGAYALVINWHLTPEEILYILRDSGAAVLFADAELGAALLDVDDQLPAHRYSIGEQLVGWGDYAAFGADESTEAPENRRNGAVMGYTSGTTGRPKGVRRVLPDVSPEDGLAFNGILLSAFGLNRRDGKHLLCSPAYHAAPSGFALAALHFGQTVLIHERFVADAVLDAFESGVTNSHMVPTHFHRLLQLPAERRASADLSGLHRIVHAGAPCPPEIKKAMLDWFGPIVWEYLGATEGLVSIASPETWQERPGTVGRPFAPDAVAIKREDGTDAAPGEEGMIYFRATLPFEYHNDPEKTAASRLGDLVTVGDLGMMDHDGYVYLLDRRSDLIVSGGVNIYPAEVEAALLMHPSVQDVGVIGVRDEEWGKRVVAVVQVIEGVEPDEALREELDEHARRHLPSYKRPRRYEFLDDFPRTDAGKVKRRELRDIYDPDRPPTTVVVGIR